MHITLPVSRGSLLRRPLKATADIASEPTARRFLARLGHSSLES